MARIPPRAMFVDTSAYFAMACSSDGAHLRATAIGRQLDKDERPTVTTNCVLWELHGICLRRQGRYVALGVLDQIESSAVIQVRVTEEDEIAARRILRRYDDKEFSLTDATSFAVMERLGLTEAFAFDRHFVQYGFSTIGG